MDELTWPQLMALKKQIERRPPNDVVVGWAESKPKEQPAQSLGLPVKKGKVKRRKDGD